MSDPVGGNSGSERFGRRYLKWCLAILAALIALDLAVALGGGLAVRNEEKRTLRNPDTGIALGAEELDLGPVDAKRAVLFVHGFVGGSNNFAGVPEAVAGEGWRVRAMRLPGHGTSPRDFATRTPDELIEAVLAEVRALKEQHGRVVCIGHSMGGALSTLAASEEALDGLVLAAPYFGVTHHWYYGLRTETWVKLSAPALPWVYKGKLFLQVNRREAKKDIYSYTWLPMSGTKTLMEIGRRANRPEVLGAIECPVLLLHGDGDVAASPAAATEAVGRMSAESKRTVSLEGSNHHIFWDHDRVQVQEEILGFLETL